MDSELILSHISRGKVSKQIQTLKRPSDSPDNHRGIHKNRIRGCGPFLLLLPLISYSKLVSWCDSQFSSNRICLFVSILSVSPVRRSQALSLPPSTSQTTSVEEYIGKGQEEKGRLHHTSSTLTEVKYTVSNSV